MEAELRKLVEEWLCHSKRCGEIASEEFSMNNWQMGNVDAATSSAYKAAALRLREILDKHKD